MWTNYSRSPSNGCYALSPRFRATIAIRSLCDSSSTPIREGKNRMSLKGTSIDL